jgi:hypothetical protein
LRLDNNEGERENRKYLGIVKPKREWKEGKVHYSSAKEIYLKQMDKEHKNT